MIIDLEHAKRHVGRIDDYDDDKIMFDLQKAEAAVIGYLKVDSDTYENADGFNDFPFEIAAAVLLCFQSLYEGDGEDPLTDAVKSLVHRYRDPALA